PRSGCRRRHPLRGPRPRPRARVRWSRQRGRPRPRGEMAELSHRLLVVDDDRAIRESLRRALRLEGYDVTLAGDGAAALEAIRTDPPAAVVLDVMMPNVDGLTVCRVLRSEGDRTPILMLTARTETPDRVAGL